MALLAYLDYQLDWIYNHHGNRILDIFVSECLYRLIRVGRPILNMSGTIPWALDLDYTEESQLSISPLCVPCLWMECDQLPQVSRLHCQDGLYP